MLWSFTPAQLCIKVCPQQNLPIFYLLNSNYEMFIKNPETIIFILVWLVIFKSKGNLLTSIMSLEYSPTLCSTISYSIMYTQLTYTYDNMSAIFSFGLIYIWVWLNIIPSINADVIKLFLYFLWGYSSYFTIHMHHNIVSWCYSGEVISYIFDTLKTISVVMYFLCMPNNLREKSNSIPYL